MHPRLHAHVVGMAAHTWVVTLQQRKREEKAQASKSQADQS